MLGAPLPILVNPRVTFPPPAPALLHQSVPSLVLLLLRPGHARFRALMAPKAHGLDIVPSSVLQTGDAVLVAAVDLRVYGQVAAVPCVEDWAAHSLGVGGGKGESSLALV